MADAKEITHEEASIAAGQRMTWHPGDVVIEDPDGK